MSTLAVLCCVVWFSHLNGCVGEDTGCAERNPLAALRISGCCTGLVVLQQVTWGQKELWLDKTCCRRNSASKLWIGNGRERERQCCSLYTPPRLHRHSLGEAGWGKLPEGCSSSVCLLLASLDVRSISTIQTSTLWGIIWGFVWKSRLGYYNTEPCHLCSLALNAQFGVLKDL